jgi:hypothetical protein
MTDIKRERILAAVATALASTTGVSGRVYRSRTEAFARNEAPAIVIEPGDDVPSQEPISTCRIDWRLTVNVLVHTRGAIPDQLAAPIVDSLHSKLLADPSLGGLALDVWPSTVQHQREQGDATAGWTVCPYVVRYRTSTTDLTS